MTSSTILTDSTDRFGYDTIAETYHAQYDWTSDSPLSITVVGGGCRGNRWNPRRWNPSTR